MQNLVEWGYAPDVEVAINEKNGGCVADAKTRYYSRLDYVIANCMSHILIVECDEFQHTWLAS